MDFCVRLLSVYLGLLIGGRDLNLGNWWGGVAGALAFAAAAGIWTAVRRISKPSWSWLTLGGLVAGLFLLTAIYSNMTVERFWSVLGVPPYSIQPTRDNCLPLMLCSYLLQPWERHFQFSSG